MSSSPETAVLRGQDADRATPARLDAALRGHRYLRGEHDPRLMDPTLDRAFAESTEAARQVAKAEGYAAGYASGREVARREVLAEATQAAAHATATLRAADERLARAAYALSSAADGLSRALVPTYDQIGRELGPAALALVEALLGRELELSPATVLDAVHRIATTVPAEADLILYVHPSDLASVQEPGDGIDLSTLIGRPVVVRTDPSVEPGGAVGVHGATRVDACLASALGRVREVLAP